MPETMSVFASASDDLKIWSAEDMQVIKQYNYHESNVKDLAWNHDNTMLASTCLSGQSILLSELHLLRNDKPRLVKTIAANEQQTSVCFGSSPKLLFSGGTRGDINSWDYLSGKLKKNFQGSHPSPVTCLTLNSSETHLASACTNGEIRIWMPGSGTACATLTDLKGHAVRGLEYASWNEFQFGTTSDDGALSLWDSNKKVRKHTFSDAHHAPAMDLSYSPLNHLLLGSCGLDKKLVLYDMNWKKFVRTVHADHPLMSMCFMADGMYICAGSSLGTLYKFDLRKTSEPLCEIQAHSTSIQKLVLFTLPKKLVSDRDRPRKSSSRSKSNSNNELKSETTNSILPKEKHSQTKKIEKHNSESMARKSDTRPLTQINSNSLSSGQNEKVAPIHLSEPARPKIEFEHGPDALANTPGVASNHSSFRDTLGSYCEDIFSPVAMEFRGESTGHQENCESFILPTNGEISKSSKRGRPSTERNANIHKENLSSHLQLNSATPAPVRNSQKSNSGASKSGPSPRFPHSPKFFLKTNLPPSPLATYSNDTAFTGSLPQKSTSQSSQSDSDQGTPPKLTSHSQTSLDSKDQPDSQEASKAGASNAPEAFQYQMDFLRNTVKHLIEEHEDNVRDQVNHLHLQIIKMVFDLEEKIEKLAERCSVNPLLLEEVERLRIENDRLRRKH